MEILLATYSTSLIAVDKGGSRLDLTSAQQNAILKRIQEKCSGCNICNGATRVSNKGFIYENSAVPVPSTCPANGDSVTV